MSQVLPLSLIEKNFYNLKQEINKIVRHEVSIVIVTKYIEDITLISQLADIGITDIGENYAQDMQKKYELLIQTTGTAKFRWHFIGHLQKNKVKKVVPIADLIQSVDSFELAQEIDRQGKKINKIQNCLIEVKVSPEPTKYGCLPENVEELVNKIKSLSNIRICGLMAMAPFFENPELARPYFRVVSELYRNLSSKFADDCPHYLSMGMSNDYLVAIEEGANMIRIGSKILLKG